MSERPDMRARVAALKQRVSLSALVGRAVKLTRRGREFAGLCPFHQERTPSFTVNDGKDFYHCFGCGAHGDAIRFVMDHDGLDFVAALERLEQDAGLQAVSAAHRDPTKVERPSQYIDGKKAAAVVWGEAQPARGELPEAFLRSRGIDPDCNGLLDVARFHPRCPAALWRTWEGPNDARRHAPALVAPMLRIAGPPGGREIALAGVHLTFLAPDGRGKARFQPWQDRKSGELRTPPSRVMWGAAARAAVPIPCNTAWRFGADPEGGREAIKAWLVALLDAPHSDAVVIGEGLESTQSLMNRTPCRIGFATLSLGNLQGAIERVGPKAAVPLYDPKGALASSSEAVGQQETQGAPFTFDRPGRVTIGVDSDMKPTQPLWVQEAPRALAVKRALSGLERAQLCGQLAAWHWRRAGAERVSVVRPEAGLDFNDLDTPAGWEEAA